MTRIARWCVRHRFTVLAAWVLLLGGTAIASRALGTDFANGFTLPGTESTRALDLLAAGGLGVPASDDTIVFHSTAGRITDPQIRAGIEAMLASVGTLPLVSEVTSPFASPGGAQLSADDTVAFAVVTFREQNQDLTQSDVQPLVSEAASVLSPSLDVEFGGLGFQSLKGSPTSGSELVGIGIAAIVLLIAFGSLLSAATPLIAALFAVGTGEETIALLSHFLPVNALAPTVAALIGLGVAIDYALFVVVRHRSGLSAGLTTEDAAARAIATSGRAVVFAGGTVAVAMLGLAVLQVSFLTGVGIAAAIVVLYSVVAAITLLPALFGILGARVLSRGERRRLAGGVVKPGESRRWAAWAALVQRHPVALGIASTAIMVILLVPALSLRLGSSDQGNDPAGSTTRKAYDLLALGFGPGSNGPLTLVAEAPAQADQAALIGLASTIRSTPGVATVSTPTPIPGGDIWLLKVIPSTAPESTDTAALIDALRRDVIPVSEVGTGLRVYVGGQTAIFQDFADGLAGKLPLFVLVVVLLGCLLLMVAFRSIVIPLTAALMNLLAAAASVGVVVAVFQWGWGSEALGLGRPGPIEAFLPVMLVAILFGLSMDYQVFLVSRIHEEWIRTSDNDYAVRTGLTETGRVITAAAAIMIAVFLAFVLGGRRPIGEFGLALATAILLDAVLLRTILVPAAMHLFGRRNWWLPARLGRLLPRASTTTAPGSE